MRRLLWLIVLALVPLAAAFVLWLEFTQVIEAQSSPCTPPTSNNQYWTPGTTITVYVDPTFSQGNNNTVNEAGSINTALSNWFGQSALTGNNITMTTTTTDPGPNAQNTIRVVNNPAGSPNSPAHTDTSVVMQNGASTGQMFNATISFNRNFMLNSTTPAYDPAQSSAGSFVTKAMDHELGHVFGENDAPIPTNPTTGQPDVCAETPGATVMNGSCGTNDAGAGGVSPTNVTPCDNNVVNKDIQTQGGRTGTGGGGTPPRCPPGSKPNLDGGCNPSPIIIDAEGEGFHLTSATDGVTFDIVGDGHPIQIAWTDSGYHNAFLGLPGPDGLIHNGKELFGNFTPQSVSDNPNGFAALAQYDKSENGGNGDGLIDEHDSVFSRLRLWIDENHDGICQLNELHRLPELGVYSLAINFTESQRTDEFGNQFRFRARVNPGSRRDFRDERQHGETYEAGRWAYDVFFVTK